VQHVRPVDFAAFRPADFHSQRIADTTIGLDSCVVLLTRVPPGTGTTGGLHIHPAHQLYFVLRGTMQVQLGPRQLVAETGQLVFIPRGMPHWNWNAGETDELHFELIVPAPPAGAAVAERVESDTPPPDLPTDQLIRTLDLQAFAADRASRVVLAEPATGLDAAEIGVVRLPPGTSDVELPRGAADQLLYVLAGAPRGQVGAETHTLAPHTLVIAPAGVPYRTWNDASADALILTVALR
jgi:quercetin dioxygenase-like cupin family protein